jgi:hypothetical protein
LIFWSTSGSLKADSLVPNPISSMSVDWKIGGIHVAPYGQSEHHP